MEISNDLIKNCFYFPDYESMDYYQSVRYFGVNSMLTINTKGIVVYNRFNNCICGEYAKYQFKFVQENLEEYSKEKSEPFKYITLVSQFIIMDRPITHEDLRKFKKNCCYVFNFDGEGNPHYLYTH